jgi:hypothetical protein
MQVSFRTTPANPMVASLAAAGANRQRLRLIVGGHVEWLGN